jgi:hypothetical protein
VSWHLVHLLWSLQMVFGDYEYGIVNRALLQIREVILMSHFSMVTGNCLCSINLFHSHALTGDDYMVEKV